MKSTLINVCDKRLCVSEINSSILLDGSESIHPSQKSICDTFWGHFPLLVLFLCSPCSAFRKKRSHRQQIEIANIHISAEPSLDLSPNILSVSICLQFFLLSLPPSLPPSRSAPIGSRSCSTGRLLAPSHQNLARAARICPHTNRSLAFCLWMDGTEREGREEKWGGGAAKCVNPVEYAALWATSHFTQWSRTAIVKRH